MKRKLANRIIIVISFATLLIFRCESDLRAGCRDTICNRNLQIELRTSWSFTVCHHQEMNLFRAHFPIFELSLQQTTFGSKTWHQLLNYPAVGVTVIYSGVGGMPEIGSIFGAYPYMSFNFLKSKRNMLNARLGVGIGYATKKWDAKDNPKNTFLGSHVNALFSINVEYSRAISRRWHLSFYTGMTHMSNGGSRCPNNGINLWQFGLSGRYFLKQQRERLPLETIDNKQYRGWESKNISWYISFLYSLKDIDEYMGYGKHWSVYNLQLNVMKHVSQMSKVGIGIDLVYDETDKEILKFKKIDYKPIEILKPGVNVAYELVLKSTSFLFNFGCHVGGKDLCEGRIYQKLNLKQNVSEHIFVTFGLTTHWGWADYLGFGVGFKIN